MKRRFGKLAAAVLLFPAVLLCLTGCAKAPNSSAAAETVVSDDTDGVNRNTEDATDESADHPEEDLTEDELAEAIRPIPVLVIQANDHTFYADPEDNTSVEALIEKLSAEPLELDLHDYGSFEKVGPLPWTLPTNDTSITTAPGDVILYQGVQLTIYYDENTWNLTRLAKIRDVTKEELLEVFGEGNVAVTFWVEWSE